MKYLFCYNRKIINIMLLSKTKFIDDPLLKGVFIYIIYEIFIML